MAIRVAGNKRTAELPQNRDLNIQYVLSAFKYLAQLSENRQAKKTSLQRGFEMNRLLLEVEPGIKSVSGRLTKIADRPQTERNGVLAILLIGDVLAPKGELKGTVRTYRHFA